MPKIWIKNGKIWDGKNFFYSDLYIENGRIQEIAKKIKADADFVYDANNQIVSAGFIDSHIHLRGVSNNVLGVGDWACFPFGVTCAVDAWAEERSGKNSQESMLKSVVFIGTVIEDNHIRTDLLDLLLTQWQDKAIGIKVCFDIPPEAEDVDER